jgi:hypothetical protein
VELEIAFFALQFQAEGFCAVIIFEIANVFRKGNA